MFISSSSPVVADEVNKMIKVWNETVAQFSVCKSFFSFLFLFFFLFFFLLIFSFSFFLLSQSNFAGHFASEDIAMDVIYANPSKENVWALLVFNEFSPLEGKVDFKIRVNWTSGSNLIAFVVVVFILFLKLFIPTLL